MSKTELELITPDWPAPANVKALSTTRHGGTSTGPYAALNLGSHVGDDPQSVIANRALLGQHLPMEPLWLTQVHGTTVVNAACTCPHAEADASIARMANRICTIMTADCLPVLFCDTQGTAVGAAHAGWRGLNAGILEATVKAMQTPPGEIMAWLGPAIGPDAFEVGSEVRTAFIAHALAATSAFRPSTHDGKWLADLYQLARQRLAACGVTQVYGGNRCTFTEEETFFSYRRDSTTGRMASLIWLE
ncbi:MAG: hypothetical protein H6R07_3320 [Proteobacteria bacterium]|nr:hypothetical protein [Pseudomonadota bacterium]